MLEVFDGLLPSHPNLKLTIVSSLQTDHYASNTDKTDRVRAISTIKKWPKHIAHHTRLPNSEVINLMAKADVALLPTYADTFGYSVLEAQACGVPVITTDIRALPEINDNNVGWIIPVPKDDNGNAKLGDAASRALFSKMLVDGLREIILGLLEGSENPIEKGEKARARIAQHHDPMLIAALVREQYEKALS